jgi:3-oxoacyl-[acyl-carrier protein] reductase
MGLEGRAALVTGASRGIGRAIALRLAKDGADVAVNFVRDPAGQNERDAAGVVAEIGKLGRKALAVHANVADEAEVTAMVAEVIQKLGGVHILVNNAGIVRDVTLKKMDKAEWDAVLAVNLTGAFHCTKAAMGFMRESGWGRIISLSSVIGQTGNIGQANYAASKAGLMGFTKSVAREVALRGITANAVAPGFIETDMLRTVPEDIRKAILSRIPAGRFGAADDVANVVAFLASNEAAYITGQIFNVNGGYYM